MATGRWLPLALGALGVVYGDIGTSPLYTWSEIRRHGSLTGDADILGACGLIVWTLTLIILGKYVGLVLRADNHGEGGTFALQSQLLGLRARGVPVVTLMLVFAASLLYGEGLITPAISVLSAVEGIAVFDAHLDPFVVPLTLAVIFGLFAFQYLGTGQVGKLFGPIMVAWFASISVLGVVQIVGQPQVLSAFLPHHAFYFLTTHSLAEILAVLGSVVLCITGGEALYADMGHFGGSAIRRAWMWLVYPALLCSYLGQAAFLMTGAEIHRDNVFFSMVPGALMIPMVILATFAAIIASQALISGAFSLTRSAINLGLLPRVSVVHTNREVEGQIYMPAVNWFLCIGCSLFVVFFQRSANLAAAYGLAVTGTMFITTIAMTYIARLRWGWKPWVTVAVFGTFGVVELWFLAANVLKIPSGAWVPLVIVAPLFAIMRIWPSGRRRLANAYARVERFTVRELMDLKMRMPELPRAMVFLTQETVHTFDDPVPLVLLKFVDRYGAIPKHLTLFSIVHEGTVPFWREKRFDVRQFGDNVTSVRMHVGYMESPNTRAALVHLKQQRQVRIHATRWTIVMGREELVIEHPGSLLSRIQSQVFSLLQQMGSEAHVWFGLGGDTGISKEVIPVKVGHGGEMEVVVRAPDLDSSWLAPQASDEEQLRSGATSEVPPDEDELPPVALRRAP
jgi:KUP system potassium uptake protein